ncbi:unnamed protein product [Periconia digitata]|uniref:Uncharacterized protein n=1 Tax=Periconia digitata TaxID=1303443 RepID=A0A9W4UD16_9PLEO|nr:unnamed protein product [Periconia digitata]
MNHGTLVALCYKRAEFSQGFPLPLTLSSPVRAPTAQQRQQCLLYPTCPRCHSSWHPL